MASATPGVPVLSAMAHSPRPGVQLKGARAPVAWGLLWPGGSFILGAPLAWGLLYPGGSSGACSGHGAHSGWAVGASGVMSQPALLGFLCTPLHVLGLFHPCQCSPSAFITVPAMPSIFKEAPSARFQSSLLQAAAPAKCSLCRELLLGSPPFLSQGCI